MVDFTNMSKFHTVGLKIEDMCSILLVFLAEPLASDPIRIVVGGSP